MKSFNQFIEEGWGAETQKRETELANKKWEETLERHKDHPENHKLLRYMRLNNWSASSAERELTAQRPRLSRDAWNKYMTSHEAKFGPIKEDVHMGRWMNSYDKREDENQHSLNTVHLTKLVGSEEDQKAAKAVYDRHTKSGMGISDSDHAIRTELNKRLWPKAVQKHEEWKNSRKKVSEEFEELVESRGHKLVARAIKNLETRKKIASGEVKTGAAQPKQEEQKKPELKSEQVENLLEWNAQGRKHESGEEFMTANGYENVGGSKHSKWKHKDTGHIVTGWGHHGKEIEASVARKARRAVMQHHEEKNLPFTEWA